MPSPTTNEVEAFIRKAHRSLRAGEVLIIQGLAEHAIDRAYYAMFYAAKAMLLTRGAKAAKHKHVATTFEKLFVGSGTVDARFLGHLQDGFMSRHFATYETDLTSAISTEDAELTLEDARQFVAMADQFLKGDRRLD